LNHSLKSEELQSVKENPRLTAREKEDYLKAVIEINPADIDWLIGTLLYARAKQYRETTPIIFKICDFCSLTYPYYTLSCEKCFSEKLRDFEVPPNHNDILDGLRK
jgi:ribosomal protein L40E